MTIRRIVLTALAVTLGACATTPERESAATRAPLVVVLVADQMRSSYLEEYGGAFTGGLRRLMDEGTWFRRAAYPYLNTVTCAGHATIGTGTLPYRHGMVLNAWWDRALARSMPCTTDPGAANIAYNGTVPGGDSAWALRAPPLAQQLRERTGGRSVVMSLKQRSAISMAGVGSSTVLWFDDRAGWTTSNAFVREPEDWLRAFFSAHPWTNDRGRPWERLLPIATYRGSDAGLGERAPSGWTTEFPHVVGEPPQQLHAQWQRSPFADEYLGRLAAHAVETLDLGRGPGTDFLGVSFSTLDLVGHQFGPASHEVQDLLLRLDRTIARLLELLDARLGRDGYVLAFSSDHGVADLPEQSGGNRQPSAAVVTAVNTALEPFFGPGKHMAYTVYTDLYLAPGVYDRVRATPRALEAVLDALRALPGIDRAFSSHELRSQAARSSSDPVLRAAALSHYPPRSGDLVIVPRRLWLLSTAATTHGTYHPYDQGVPVIFFGAGVKPEVRNVTVTPADIAPTLAALAGVQMTGTDGTPQLRRVAQPTRGK